MCRKILSASVSPESGTTVEIRPCPQINILQGENAEEVLWVLANIFCSYSPWNTPATIKAEVLWPGGISFSVSGEMTAGKCAISVQRLNVRDRQAERVKSFHKQRFLERGNVANIFDGTRHQQKGCMGESDAILAGFRAFLANQQDDRPLFIYNFLERLDKSIDLRPIFKALSATNHQVFIALPHTYPMENLIALEEKEYDTIIHAL